MKRQLETREEPLSKMEKREEEQFKKTWNNGDADTNCAILRPLFEKLGKLYPNFQDIQTHLITKTFVMTMLQMLPKYVQNEMSECAVNFFDALENETWIKISQDDQYRMAMQMRDTLITGIPLKPTEAITPEPNTSATEDDEDVGESYYGPNDCSICGRFMGDQCTSQCCYKTWCDKKPLRRVVSSKPPSSPPRDDTDIVEVERRLRCCVKCGKDMGTMKASQTCTDCIHESHKIMDK